MKRGIGMKGFVDKSRGIVSLIADMEVALTLALIDILHYPNDIGHLMKLPLTKLEHIALIIITIPQWLSPLCLLLLGGFVCFISHS